MFQFIWTLILVVMFSAATVHSVAAEDVYQTPEAFVADSYPETKPQKKTLKIDASLTPKVQKIMGSHYRLSEVDYWVDNGKTTWILEEIGKYQPITTGFVVDKENKIERLKVLIYRESHGWEVKHNFFTRQFKGAGLKKEKKLDKRIDGISGATLSVKALKRLSALALLLHSHVSSTP